MQNIYFIGLDAHKRTISYCVKGGSGVIQGRGTIPATRFDLDRWMISSVSTPTVCVLFNPGYAQKNSAGN